MSKGNGARWRYHRYLGKVVCSRCGKSGYAEQGDIMGSRVVKINHRRSIDGRLVYEGICYA